MNAIRFDGHAVRDEGRCFNCGLCVSECPSKAFKCNLGQISVCDKEVPVVLRQSDKLRALKLAAELKQRLIEGSFKISEPVDRIHP